MKRTITVLLGTALLGAGVTGGYLLGGRSDPTPPTEKPSDAAAEPVTRDNTCTNAAWGFTVTYPDGWHTDSAAGHDVCTLFDREPFEVAVESDYCCTDLSIFPTGIRFEVFLEQLTDPTAYRTVAREETTVAGRAAVRIELEATGEFVEPAGTRVYAYVVDADHGAAQISTYLYPHEDASSYDQLKQVVDEAAATLVLTEPTIDFS